MVPRLEHIIAIELTAESVPGHAIGIRRGRPAILGIARIIVREHVAQIKPRERRSLRRQLGGRDAFIGVRARSIVVEFLVVDTIAVPVGDVGSTFEVLPERNILVAGATTDRGDPIAHVCVDPVSVAGDVGCARDAGGSDRVARSDETRGWTRVVAEPFLRILPGRVVLIAAALGDLRFEIELQDPARERDHGERRSERVAFLALEAAIALVVEPAAGEANCRSAAEHLVVIDGGTLAAHAILVTAEAIGGGGGDIRKLGTLRDIVDHAPRETPARRKPQRVL